MEYYNGSVRRQDRLLEENRAYELLRKEAYGILSMVDSVEEEAYGIPISFVWDGKETIYLHCAPQGRKLQCIKKKPSVSFCIVGRTHVISNKFTTEYESLVIKAYACVGLAEEERKYALRLLLQKYAPGDLETGLKYAEKSFHRTEIIKLSIRTFSGKGKKVQD